MIIEENGWCTVHVGYPEVTNWEVPYDWCQVMFPNNTWMYLGWGHYEFVSVGDATMFMLRWG